LVSKFDLELVFNKRLLVRRTTGCGQQNFPFAWRCEQNKKKKRGEKMLDALVKEEGNGQKFIPSPGIFKEK
jgi:hypothetical protein